MQSVELLKTLVAIPSVNPMGRDVSGPQYYEGRVSDWLVGLFRELGVEYERIEVAPGRDNVIARYFAGENRPTVLLDAHQDTVPVEGMVIPPFEPAIRDGRLYGRGSCDVKGGLASMLAAFARLVKNQPDGAANVIMSCTCDEESTSLGIQHLCTLWDERKGTSRLLNEKPDLAIIAEPTGLDVVVAHRGASRWKIRTTGRACHSSRPSDGVNAIYRMARVLSLLEEYAELLPKERAAHPLCGPPTLSVGRIEGGISVNVVPDNCEIEIDRRCVPGEDGMQAIRDVETYLRERLDFEFESLEPWIIGWTLSDHDNGPLCERLLKCVEAVAGPHRKIGVAYGTHASRTSGSGIPSVVFGPGSIDQAHTKDEWIEIAQLEQAADVYYGFCADGW